MMTFLLLLFYLTRIPIVNKIDDVVDAFYQIKNNIFILIGILGRICVNRVYN